MEIPAWDAVNWTVNKTAIAGATSVSACIITPPRPTALLRSSGGLPAFAFVTPSIAM